MNDINSYSLDFGVSLGGTSAWAENGKIFARSELGDQAMWLDLTENIIAELRDIDCRYNFGDASGSSCFDEASVEWRYVRCVDWWLEAFEENVRNRRKNYDEEMRDFEVFQSSFSM